MYRTDLNYPPIRHGAKGVVGRYDPEYGNKIEVISPRDAAMVFAYRAAQQTYGRSGYCANVREDSWKQNRRWFLFEAFIGVPAEGGGTSGRNIWFTVTVDE